MATVQEESMITEAAKFIQTAVQEEEEEEADDKFLCLLLFSFIGICIYIGLCSGYIPSPLYRRGERWPIWYQALQVLMLCLTIAHLDFSSSRGRKKEKIEELWLDDLADMTQFLGTDLTFFYEEGGLMEGLMYMAAFYIVAKGFEQLETRQIGSKKLENDQKEQWSIGFIVLRNLTLLAILTLLSVKEDLGRGDISTLCEKVNPNGDFYHPPQIK